jgi:hypothetical protein
VITACTGGCVPQGLGFAAWILFRNSFFLEQQDSIDVPNPAVPSVFEFHHPLPGTGSAAEPDDYQTGHWNPTMLEPPSHSGLEWRKTKKRKKKKKKEKADLSIHGI